MTGDAPKLSGSQVTAAACVAVVVPGLGAWVGAHTGTRGTVIGTAIGAVLSVLTGWAVLRLMHHARSGLALEAAVQRALRAGDRLALVLPGFGAPPGGGAAPMLEGRCAGRTKRGETCGALALSLSFCCSLSLSLSLSFSPKLGETCGTPRGPKRPHPDAHDSDSRDSDARDSDGCP